MIKTDRQFLETNLDIWGKIHPLEAKLVQETSLEKTAFFKEENGELNLAFHQEGSKKFYHRPKGAFQEAKELFFSLDLRGIDVLYMHGIGLGYFFLAAQEWLEDPEHYLIFIETDLEVIHQFFSTDLAQKLFEHPQVLLHFVSSKKLMSSDLIEIVRPFFQKSFLIEALPFYKKEWPKLFEKVVEAMHLSMNWQMSASIEYFSMGPNFLDNFFRNLSQLPKSYLADQLFGKFQNIPAIVCGAGPSLNKNLPLLRTLKDKALIIAGGSAMNAVCEEGFVPHFGLGVDPNPSQYTRLLSQSSFEVPFFYVTRLFSLCFEVIHADLLYLHGNQGYKVSEWLEKKLGIKAEKELPAAWNVVTTGVALAAALGCNPIICVGVDLAYSDQASYAESVRAHPIHDWIADFSTKSTEDHLIVRNDIFGKPVQTLWKWVQESLWYQPFALEQEGLVLVNATEGGIGFPGVPNMTLENVSRILLTKKFDFDTMIHGCIQNSKVPSSINGKTIEEILKTLQQSLIQCDQYCQMISEEIQRILGQFEKSEDSQTWISEKMMEALSSLDQEEGYAALIDVYNEQYTKFKQNDLLALGEESVLFEKTKQDLERFLFLSGVAKTNIERIRRVLEEGALKEEPLALSSAVSLKDKESQGSYLWDGKRLQMIDPELDLQFDKEMSLSRKVQTYPSGELQIEQFYLNEELFGPMSFFSKEGTLLSKVWYLNHEKEGKGIYYYASGALYAIKRFRKGVQHGLQEFFYENGQTRSQLQYSFGFLEGKQALYHSNGQLKRECFLFKGKWDKRERIWNLQGQLLMEAHYAQGLPCKVAKSWYPSGKLAKEVTYGKEGQLLQVLRWNYEGVLYSDQRKQQEDFFDQVSKQAHQVSDSLETVFHQVDCLAPIMAKDNQERQIFLDELLELKDGLQKLKKLSILMMEETGLSLASKKEPIWKTPEQKRWIEERLKEISKTLNIEMEGLTKFFTQTEHKD